MAPAPRDAAYGPSAPAGTGAAGFGVEGRVVAVPLAARHGAVLVPPDSEELMAELFQAEARRASGHPGWGGSQADYDVASVATTSTPPLALLLLTPPPPGTPLPDPTPPPPTSGLWTQAATQPAMVPAPSGAGAPSLAATTASYRPRALCPPPRTRTHSCWEAATRRRCTGLARRS